MNLRDILADLIIDANQHQLYTMTVDLFRGLTVKVYVDDLGLNHLALIRKEVFPSQSEWDTVMRAWPQPLPEPAPKPEEKVGRRSKALVAIWKTPVPQMGGAR